MSGTFSTWYNQLGAKMDQNELFSPHNELAYVPQAISSSDPFATYSRPLGHSFMLLLVLTPGEQSFSTPATSIALPASFSTLADLRRMLSFFPSSVVVPEDASRITLRSFSTRRIFTFVTVRAIWGGIPPLGALAYFGVEEQPVTGVGDGGREWVNTAEHHHRPTTLLAYKTFLRLLAQYLITLPSLPQHLPVLKNLTLSLAVDAFSACLRNYSPTDAVELLEQGWGVFWNQLSRLRSPLDEVIASGPEGKTSENEFTELTLIIRNALDSPGADQHDRL